MSIDKHGCEPPLCPVTGEPAEAFVQSVSCGFLARLWEIEFGVDARPSLAGLTQLSLWRSPAGLMFFSPAPVGDGDFYRRLYERIGARRLPRAGLARPEYALARQLIAPGARVLDVGSGEAGAFRPFAAHADYHRFDPHFALESEDAALLGGAETFDAVCAFQVIEHVARPAALFAQMAAALKPGGRAIVSVPHVPSAMTRIPNFLLNAPPHHLTWWTREALAALARREGLAVERLEALPWSKVDSPIYWIARATPLRRQDVYYRAAWSWHAAALAGFAAGLALDALLGPPKRLRDEGAGLLLVARKPGN